MNTNNIIAPLLLVLLLTTLLGACVNNIEDVENLTESFNTTVETATNVEILYSDSAQIKVKISGPTMNRYLSRENPREEFPDGVHVEFYGDNGQIASWLDADYAVRETNNSRIITQQNVNLYNKKNEKLETWELIWDEKADEVYTDRFVMLTQPERGDTSYGYGFLANNDFTRFEIKKNSGKMNISEVTKELDGN